MSNYTHFSVNSEEQRTLRTAESIIMVAVYVCLSQLGKMHTKCGNQKSQHIHVV